MAQMTLDQLNTLDAAGFTAALADLFEHSPWVPEVAAAGRPYTDLTALFDGLKAALLQADEQRQLAVIRSHPDLADRAARTGAMTTDSISEQASAGLDRLTEEEFTTFHRLNDAYKAKFGFPFIISVRRHTRDSILRQFELRLQNDAAAERATALNEIFRIVALRLDQHVRGPDKLKVHGRISTHVLDTHGGHPGAGIAVALFEVVASGSQQLIARGVTNDDGRTDAPLIAGRPVPIGTYELDFDIGAYFAAQGASLVDPPFLGVVKLRFGVAEAEGHYHIPLLCTPWGYTTYRGS